MLLRMLVGLAAGFIAVSSWGQVKPPTATLPLVMLGRSPAIHAVVNGHDALLELDTGSFELRLSPAYVKKWEIETPRVTLQMANAPTMMLKPLVEPIADPDASPLAAKFQQRSDGIIGLDVLRKFAVGLDTVGGQVALWYGGQVGIESVNAWAQGTAGAPKNLALTRMDLQTHGDDDWYRVKARINGKPLNLILDTGTAYSTVNPSLVNLLHLRIVGETSVEEIGHSEHLMIAAADSIGIGPLKADFPVVNVEREDDGSSDGILGTEALGSGKFVIDMPGLALYAARIAANRGNALEKRMRAAGLDVFPDPDDRLLVLVSPGSSAAKLGCQSGDRLLKIGDLTIEEMIGGLKNVNDPKQLRRVLDLGLKALSGDLTMSVQRRDGTTVSVPLPKVASIS